MDFSQYQQTAIEVASQLAKLGLSFFQGNIAGTKEKLLTEYKRDRTLVSKADRAIETLARTLFAQATPNFGFVGEEFGATAHLGKAMESKNELGAASTQGKSLYPKEYTPPTGLLPFEYALNNEVEQLLVLDEDTYWIVDPIDGTINFLAGVPLWSVLIALIHKGEPVVAAIALPSLNELFFASKGAGAYFCSLFDNSVSKQPCFVTPTPSLAETHASCSSPKVFAHRGVADFFNELNNGCRELRTHSDAFGYTRILRGGIDLMIDPIAAPYDLAAVQLLFDETPGAVFTTLQGHSGHTRYRMGSALAASSDALANETLQVYFNWLTKREESTYRELSESHSAWALALEKGTAGFLLAQNLVSYAQFPHIEDISILRGWEESTSISLKNGADTSPPSFGSQQAVHIRAVVAGGTSLVTATLPVTEPSKLVLQALEIAFQQAQELNLPIHTKILAFRDPVLGDLSQEACMENWEPSALYLQEIATFLRHQGKKQAEQPNSKIHVVSKSLNLLRERREQTFLDGSQHHYKRVDFKAAVSYTSKEGEEKRRASFRLFHSFVPTLNQFEEKFRREELFARQRAVDLLTAPMVPEDISYDFLAVDADLLGLILHEAVGHAAEGDLVYLGQSGFADAQSPNGLVAAPVSQNWLNIVVDGSLDNCGYVPVDSEGVLPKRKLIVENGILIDCLHTRQTAKVAGKSPDGCSRQESLFHPSLNRMTSIWLQSKKARELPLINALCERNDPQNDALCEGNDRPSPKSVQAALERDGYLEKGKTILFLSGWKGGTASCTNLEFRADVASIHLLNRGEIPLLMREANFTGIATKCFLSAADAYGPIMCHTIGTCGKDAQGVPTSDGGPAIILLQKADGVMVIGSGDAQS